MTQDREQLPELSRAEIERQQEEAELAELEAAGAAELAALEEEVEEIEEQEEEPQEEYMTTEEALAAAEFVEDEPEEDETDDIDAAIQRLRDAGYDVSVAQKEAPREDKEPEEAMKAARDEKKRRLAQVLMRGRVNSKVQAILDRFVPEGRAGKLIRDTPEDIAAHENLGFTFEAKPGAEGTHGTADGRVRVGDTVLMTIALEDQELIRELRSERVKQNVGGAAEEEFMKNSDLGYNESQTRIGGK